MSDRDWEIARKWLDRAQDLEMHMAEYDPDERGLPEVHLMEVEAETLRKCASDLLARANPHAPNAEEIIF